MTRLESFRHLAGPLYATAIAVTLLPFVELVLTVLPWTPGDLSWRYGAAGLLSRTLVTPLVGLAIFLATAATLGHRGALRAILLVALGGVVLLSAVSALFLFDMLEMRAMVRPDATAAFRAGAAMALLKLAVGIGVLLTFAVGARGLLRANDRARRAAPSADEEVSSAMVFRAQ